MFCAKTHNMGFVSPTDQQNTNCALAGSCPSGLSQATIWLRHKGELRPSLNPSASQIDNTASCFRSG